MLESYVEVDSFKFGDIIKHWGRERLVHDVLIFRELARGVVREGLRFQSVDPKWEKPNTEFRGYPLVGYSARQDLPPVMLRAVALEHLLAVARDASEPDPAILHAEFVTKHDFRNWLVHSGKALPAFWYAAEERYKEA